MLALDEVRECGSIARMTPASSWECESHQRVAPYDRCSSIGVATGASAETLAFMGWGTWTNRGGNEAGPA
jgi:hypothetical protein